MKYPGLAKFRGRDIIKLLSKQTSSYRWSLAIYIIWVTHNILPLEFWIKVRQKTPEIPANTEPVLSILILTKSNFDEKKTGQSFYPNFLQNPYFGSFSSQRDWLEHRHRIDRFVTRSTCRNNEEKSFLKKQSFYLYIYNRIFNQI